jgi:hypothetical protein
MFRCQNQGCKTVTPPRQPENKITLETRPKTYENKIKRGKQKGTILITHGSEIIKEISVCPSCFSQLTGLKPKEARPEPQKPRRKLSKPSFRKDKKQWTNPRNRKNQKANSRHKKDRNKTEEPRKAPVVEVVQPLHEQSK